MWWRMFDSISAQFGKIVRSLSGISYISEMIIQDAVDEILVALLEADVIVRVVRRFVNRTMVESSGEKVRQ